MANAKRPEHGYQHNYCACGRLKRRYAETCWSCWVERLRARQPEVTYHHQGRAHVVVNGKRVRRARVVLEQARGWPLLPDEFVHHMNLDPTDDDPTNLVALSNEEHIAIHAALRIEQGQWMRGETSGAKRKSA